MKNKYLLFISLFVCTFLNAQIINFPDPAFKARLLAANSWNHVAENAAGISVVIDTNGDGNIQVSEALLIRKLDVYNGGYIQSIVGVDYFTNLISLNCSQNGISAINVSMLSGLKTLICDHNQALTSLNISGLVQLEELNVNSCNLTSLSVNGLSALKKIICYWNQLSTLDLSGLSLLEEVNCSSNILTSIATNGLPNLKILDCSNNQLVSFNPTNIPALEELYVGYNVNLTSINLTGMLTLKRLECNACHLTTLNLSSLTNLLNLRCEGNLLQTINFSGLTNLLGVDCSFNQLTELQFGGISGLTYLDCSGNQLSNLTINNLVNLLILRCQNNLLLQLDVSPLQQLTTLNCSSNQLQYLNCSMLQNLDFLICSANQLEFLNVKNGRNEFGVEFWGNPTMDYICVDEGQRQFIQQMVSTYLQYNTMGQCVVGDYCSFAPGGTFYTIEGNSKVDLNTNGCDAADAIYPNLNFSISNGSILSSFISGTTGNYSFPVESGTHTITPIIENPTYFSVSPSNFQVTFPTAASPHVQNFCFTPNGIHSDLEINLLPIIPARPGFDATYKLVIKNKGNSVQSGVVTFSFEDDKMDLVSSIPNYSALSIGLLTFNYANLQPLEIREMVIVLNINSPVESPAVVIGDELNFSAIINPLSGDEYVFDNTSNLKQTVVGSYDPNDKTCIEGNVVGTEMIGQYVHYVIRFENTGTFAAENIVVKDQIDLAKFDLNSLVPNSSSHAFVTRMDNLGKVEFIFEGINLPFDDANNDGYVAFKIKTKSNLAVGDTFSNHASIYFDYNYPIVTNTATTTIQALGTNDFEFTTYFTLHPNPAKEVVTILAKEDVSISSISIYNTLGQLVLVETNPNTSIDVSSIKTGNYFVKIISDKGMTTTKLIKQ